jgi:hypothetical protein
VGASPSPALARDDLRVAKEGATATQRVFGHDASSPRAAIARGYRRRSWQPRRSLAASRAWRGV